VGFSAQLQQRRVKPAPGRLRHMTVQLVYFQRCCWALRQDLRRCAQEYRWNTAATIFADGRAKGGQAARDKPRPGEGAERRARVEAGTVER
jgi:hypothetical protein